MQQKTLNVRVPENTPHNKAKEVADNLAELLRTAGRIETYLTPIRPQLIPGDTAKLHPNRLIGAITAVEHVFGRRGYRTQLTVDSGRRRGKLNVVQLVNKILYH